MTEVDRLVNENIPLVHSCVRHFVGKGIEYDDLFQAGAVGLVKAAKGFEKERGLKFSTYAVPTVLGEMKRLFRDGGAVKVSRSIKELQLKIRRTTDVFRKAGKEPSVSEIASVLEVPTEFVVEAMCASAPVISLTVENDGEENQLDLPTGESEETLCNRISLNQAINTLNQTDRDIITLRYFADKTQTETAKALCLTQVQISRREKNILEKLRLLMK